MMTDIPKKSLSVQQRVLRVLALSTVAIVCFHHAAKGWENIGTRTIINMTMIKSQLDYEVEEDGTATYHFGRSGPYYVSCDGPVPATWDMSGDVDAKMLGGICKKIEAQRNG